MDTFGIGRSMEPAHSLPQQAWRIDNTTELRPDELLIDVKIVSINLVSFNEIWDETGDNDTLLCQRVMEIIQERGKLHNPVTNTGGMLYGKVAQMGSEYPNLYGLAPGDEIISLASLSITPLKLDRILCVDYACAQLTVEGQAILYASSPVVKRPRISLCRWSSPPWMRPACPRAPTGSWSRGSPFWSWAPVGGAACSAAMLPAIR